MRARYEGNEMAEVHQLVPTQRSFPAGARAWFGPEGGNVVILPCIRRERLDALDDMPANERVIRRAMAQAPSEE